MKMENSRSVSLAKPVALSLARRTPPCCVCAVHFSRVLEATPGETQAPGVTWSAGLSHALLPPRRDLGHGTF